MTGSRFGHHELPPAVEDVARRVIGCAMEVHRTLGPGLIERVYEEALVHELETAGLAVASQVEIILPYKRVRIGGQRLDLVVEDLVIVELKSIQAILDVHRAELLSDLRAAEKPVGLLLNFNAILFKDAAVRILNERWAQTDGQHTPLSASQTSRSWRPSR